MPKIVIDYELPKGANRDEVASFVIDALEYWGGQYHPEDPMFNSLRGRIRKVVVNHTDFSSLLTEPMK